MSARAREGERIFGGLRFEFQQPFKTKKEAVKAGKRLTKEGYLYRITYSYPFYFIWSRRRSK